MKHFKILAWFDSPQKESYMKSSAKNIEYELPFELLNNSRLKILGNQEIMENLKNAWREGLVQSPFPKKLPLFKRGKLRTSKMDCGDKI